MMKTQSAIAYSRPVTSKLFYRINEVSEMIGVKPHVLRYWETEFPELSPEKDASDHRRYRAKDIQTVQAIRKLLYDDRFTIKGARSRLKDELRAKAAVIDAPVTPVATIEEVREPVAVRRAPVHEDVDMFPRMAMNGRSNGRSNGHSNGHSRTRKSASRAELGETLKALRGEVGELLKMLGG